ncbi:hypothetical protein [Bacillus sp. JCM 19034]|uniref:hypothetical protein n=1 Tax=Bacillus sp. JCM 19034 TaxID=1481928 RepID=UPI00078472EF|nr:hypothetical protein [Bacillus sp. JCM 19034]
MSKTVVDQELVDMLVRKVMKKHKFKEIESDDDKIALKELVNKLQSQVDQFIENQEKTYTEEDAPKQKTERKSLADDTNVPKRKSKKFVKSDNNVNNLKIFKGKS